MLRRTALLVLTVLLLACGSSLPVDLTVAHDSEPESLDPARMSGVAEGRIAAALFEGLTRFDSRTLAVRPGVAERWDVSPNGLEWTFHLDDDSRWSDGKPVTAKDFRYSWLRLLDPSVPAPYANLLFAIRGARKRKSGQASPRSVGILAPDPHTLRIELIRPVPWFPSLTASFPLLPVPRRAVKRWGNRWTRPGHIIGNGPFVLLRHRFYREIVLERSPTYHHRDQVALHRIRILPVPDPNTQLNLYATGQVDLTFSVPSSVVGALAKRPDFVSGPRLATAFLRLNVRRPPLDDVRIRRALAHAVNRATLVKRVTRGGELPARSFVPPVLPGYEPARGPAFDPRVARALLRAAGHPGGRGIRPLSLLLPENPDSAAIATVLQAAFETELGLHVRLDVREWKVYLAAMKRGEYDLALSKWIGDYPDPTTFLDCFRVGSGNNRTGFADPVYDELLDRASAPLTNESPAAFGRRRVRLLREAEARLLLAAPIVTLYHPTSRFLVSPRVKGFVPNVLGLVRFADLRIAPKRGS